MARSDIETGQGITLADDGVLAGGDAMAGGNRRKCKCCLTLFRPDPRNRRHQRYCSAAACRAASKAASQARWLAAPENQGYFRGPVNVARVQAWRSRHPGYWRRASPCRHCVTRSLNGATR